MDRSPRDVFGNALPYLNSIVYHIVSDFDTELAMFKAGETDVHGVLGEEYESLKPLEADGNFTIYKRGPAFGTTFLTFNLNPGHERRDWRALRGAGKAGVVPEYAIPPSRSPTASIRTLIIADVSARARLSAVVVRQPGCG